MFCRECGAGLSPDSKFCKECGAKVATTVNVKSMTLTVQDLEPVVGDVNQERLTKLLDMAFWHSDAGNLDAAVKAAEAALVINPASTTAHSLLSTLYERKGDDVRAIEHLEAVLEINPDSIADQTKLDQLQRGIHVKAIQPPVGYRWIPPALSGVTSAGLKVRFSGITESKIGNVRLLPVLASGIVVLLLLGVGYAALRNQASRANVVANDDVVSNTPHPIYNAPPPAPQIYSQPSVSEPGPALSMPTASASPSNKRVAAPDLRTTPDVWSGEDDPAVQKIFQDAEQRVMNGAPPSRPAADDGGTNPNRLPALGDGALKAVPLTSSVAPATVELPTPSAPVPPPTVSTANLPQHTVVVSQLGQNQDDGQQSTPQPATASSNTGGNGGDGLVPVVRVTVHDASSEGDAGINQGQSPSNVPAVHNDEAQSYQQYALSLQQQGDYSGAKTAYQRAIRTYKERIREGHDGDDVQRGLAACQTGLEICQQSL